MTAYAGDLTPAQAWERLQSDPAVKLVDVRTQAEWTYVGLPDLSSLGRQPILVQWQTFPSQTRNEAFAEQLKGQGIKPTDTVLFLCRSGHRSVGAAELVTQLGYTNAYNILGGFEGPLDGNRQRGKTDGWKAAGLPWVQG